jgi:putative DNA methylase
LPTPKYPLTIYYAFKQSEAESGSSDDHGTRVLASTGWETMLEGLLQAGFTITGTWPMRTELIGNLKKNIGALASSIVLVCRLRPTSAPTATRREFVTTLRRELPGALRNLQHGNIAPVDLAQAAIGPGMAIFSRYSKVVESDGSVMRVRTALQLINQALDQVLAEQEGEYDSDTRWAIAWFEQYAHDEGQYGVAEVLSKAKDTSIGGLVAAGLLSSRTGRVRLLRRDELDPQWNPITDRRITAWEVAQHLIRVLDQQGEMAGAALLRDVGIQGEIARDLAYRLYATCERKGWAQEALAYNSLVVAWPELSRLASQPVADEQTTFLR